MCKYVGAVDTSSVRLHGTNYNYRRTRFVECVVRCVCRNVRHRSSASSEHVFHHTASMVGYTDGKRKNES